MLLLAYFFTLLNFLTAQNQTIKGVVIAKENGQRIAGASILIKGTKTGTISNSNGEFSLPSIPETAKILEVSYIGMLTQTVPIRPNLKIILQTENQLLKELVVVAYGTASQSSLTGAVGMIKSAQLDQRPLTNALGALEGTLPGLQINNSYGEPGSNTINIRIRGFGSINGTNDPLIIVDGAPFYGKMTDINSHDIASISVLKDAASSALYGNKAANGVILITTKKGQGEKIKFEAFAHLGLYNRAIPEYQHLNASNWMEKMHAGYQRFLMIDRKMDESSAAQEASASLMKLLKSPIFNKADDELFDANGHLTASIKPQYTDLDWMKPLERNGRRQEYGINATTQGRNYDLFTSFNYLNEEGYLVTSDFNRFTGRINANLKPTTWLKTGINLAGTLSKSNFVENPTGTSSHINPFDIAQNMAPIYPYYQHDAEGNVVLDEANKPKYNLNNKDYLNNRHLIYELENDQNQYNRQIISGQAFATLNFLKDFSFTIKGNLYQTTQTEKKYNNPICGDGAFNNGQLSKTISQDQDYQFSQELNWTRDYNRHHIDVLMAHEAFNQSISYDQIFKEQQKINGSNTAVSNFAKTNFTEGDTDQYTTEGYLARVRYNYDQTYFIDGSIRRDGSSCFQNHWGNFGSIGGSWMISNEPFMRKFRQVDYLKFRTSYGIVGNDSSVGGYASKTLYSLGTFAGMGVHVKTQNGNKSLKWESSSTLDIALESRLFHRLNLSIDFFNKVSKDLLFNVFNPLSAGATDWQGAQVTGMSTIYRNIGSIRNTGIELAMDMDVLKSKDWAWNIGLNLTTIKNVITQLPDDKDILHGIQNYSKGHSIYEFYTYTYSGVDELTGRALYPANTALLSKLKGTRHLVTTNDNGIEKNYVYNTQYSTKAWQGKATPDLFGNLSSTLTWKDLTLSVICSYALGGKVYDNNYQSLMSTSMSTPKALHADVLNSWKKAPEGLSTDSPERINANGIPAFDLSSYDLFSQDVSSRWLTDASYFIIKNIHLSYSIPQRLISKLGVNRLNLSGTIENAATFTSRKGLNPQYSFAGIQSRTFVAARIYSLGLTMNF